jgi:hypothetical protein
VAGGTFVDKKTGARDPGSALNVTDYPCVAPTPEEEQQDPAATPIIFGTKRLYVQFVPIQVRINGLPGPWLAGMTLDPSMMYQAWCHRRGYICMIGFLGGIDVKPGESFTNVNLVGYFDTIDEMNKVYDKHTFSSTSGELDDFLRRHIEQA